MNCCKRLRVTQSIKSTSAQKSRTQKHSEIMKRVTGKAFLSVLHHEVRHIGNSWTFVLTMYLLLLLCIKLFSSSDRRLKERQLISRVRSNLAPCVCDRSSWRDILASLSLRLQNERLVKATRMCWCEARGRDLLKLWSPAAVWVAAVRVPRRAQKQKRRHAHPAARA